MFKIIQQTGRIRNNRSLIFHFLGGFALLYNLRANPLARRPEQVKLNSVK